MNCRVKPQTIRLMRIYPAPNNEIGGRKKFLPSIFLDPRIFRDCPAGHSRVSSAA